MQKTTTATSKRVSNPVPALKRADRIRRERELEYSRRDARNIGVICGLGVALVYTSLWLVYKLAA